MQLSALQCEYQTNPAVLENRRPRFSWVIEAGEGDYDVMQADYRVLVATDPSLLTPGKADLWDSGVVLSDSLCAVYGGKRLWSKAVYYWQVTVHTIAGEALQSAAASFGMGLHSAEWGCPFIGQQREQTMVSLMAEGVAGAYSPYLRTTFRVEKKVRCARAFATAFGLYELHLNGSKVGDLELTPGFTDYNESLQYQGYDVTALLHEGENVVGAVLGDGWYTGNIFICGRKSFGDYPLGFRMSLTVWYEDGTTEEVVTDPALWKTANGPIVYADNQTGEYYDATRELPGWDTPGYDDSAWQTAVSADKPGMRRLKANLGPAVKTMLTRVPVSVTRDKDGRFIADMGQNMVGTVTLRLRCARGGKVTLRFGEMLKPDGTLYTENLRTARQTDTYIAKGEPGGEAYRPRFTIHGFRYVEISGPMEEPQPQDITGNVMYSGCELTGSVETDNAMVNQLFSNQLWGQRGNFVSIPTDCPQRDERMGWTGDAQVFAGTGCFNMDCAAFYEKYLEDILEAQQPDGGVTDVAPYVRWRDGNPVVGHGAAAWGDAVFVIPWKVYEMYGDMKILRDSYDGMVKYLRYLEDTTRGLLRPDEGYGDWLSIGDDTPRDVLSTAFFAYSANLTAKTARVLGLEEEAQRHEELFKAIRSAFTSAYIDEQTGVIKGDTQCCYLLALKMELLAPEKRPQAVENLIRTIERKNWHLSTGFVGVSYLLPILSEYGRDDVAYRLLLNKTYPSWGYSIENGATTIWERWNSYTRETGFGDVGMNSFNHYSLGSAGEWMYRCMAGINPVAPGFRKLVLQPHVSRSLGHANAAYRSAAGVIRSGWEWQGDKLVLHFTVPANTTAELSLPAGKAVQLKGNAQPAREKDGRQVFAAGSGEYVFEVSPAKA